MPYSAPRIPRLCSAILPLRNIAALLWALGLAAASPTLAADIAPAESPALNPTQLAIVINTESPLSVSIGAYYAQARHIPAANVIKVSIPGSPHQLSQAAFDQLEESIAPHLGPTIQALALIWTAPYAVECNSLTSALTLGYEADLCAHTCIPSQTNPLFDADTTTPYTTRGLRFSMLLPTESEAEGRALIDRGVASDASWPRASGYFLTTSDVPRSSRARYFPPSGRAARRTLTLVNLHADSIRDRHDVMFYFTGERSVPHLDTLTFLPGAVADHLTSTGGDLLGTMQMSSLRWLEAGATASYGSVSEPCSYPEKFPNPAVLLKHYLNGESLIEAYWKSVEWPTQGVFIGEPLAAPYKH
jgi:uncharacterized protein (TIGR03790 family)